MDTMGPMANLRDWNFPTQEVKRFMGENLVYKKNKASVMINSNFTLGISKVMFNEFIIIPKYFKY